MARAIGVSLVLFAGAGCAPLGPRDLAQTSLRDIACNATTRQELHARFGPPSVTLDDHRAAAWRLSQEPGGGAVVLHPVAPPAARGLRTWTIADHSLVVEFNDRDVVRRVSLVRVK